MPPNDGENLIVERARAGDRAAFEDLVRRTSRLVFARLVLETGDAHRAEDLLQETYLKAMKSIRTLKDDATFRSWLLAIARNVLIDDARKTNRQKREALPDLPSKDSPAHDGVERAESRQRILAALRSLPEEYQLPLALRYLAGADCETISVQLGLTNGALRGYLHRGLKQLRERLPKDL